MARVKRGVTSHARHKKVLKLAKGYRGRSHNCIRIAIEKVEKALQYAYRDRRNKKRDLKTKIIRQRIAPIGESREKMKGRRKKKLEKKTTINRFFR